LELGPVARTLSVPLRYALAVPIMNGATAAAVGVLTAYGSEPFNSDHKRLLESAATLFASSVTSAGGKDTVGKVSVGASRQDSRVH
jgi:hypothetical protein